MCSSDLYKVQIGESIIDIWNLNETWGLKTGQLTFEFHNLYKLPDTTFFNFSSIIFSFKENKFIIGRPFLDFLKKAEIDLVSDKNPYPELCVVNTMYYQKRLNYKLSRRLKCYLVEKEGELPMSKLSTAQIKHYNKIIFSEDEILSFFHEIKTK